MPSEYYDDRQVIAVEELDKLIDSAQAGHQEAREMIIIRLKPLVIKTAASLSGRYIDPSNDEMSIGMVAINQAIDKYQATGGAGFISYSELIIKRRLIDYYRQEQRLGQALPFSSVGRDDQESPLDKIEHQGGLAQYQQVREEDERRDEITKFAQELINFGITFSDLVAHSPKHEDARLRAMEVAQMIAGQPEWIHHLQQKKELPLKQITLATDLSRKTLDRQRKYIIGITLVFLGDYRYLRSYLDKISK